MPLIYLKLNTGHNYFYDERLNFLVTDPGQPAGVLDYSNLTTEVSNAIVQQVLVQITPEEYYNLSAPPEPIDVNSGYLISLDSYIQGCPPPTSIFFTYYDGQWYKIKWSDIKACIDPATGNVRRIFRVGDPNAVAPLPQPGDSTFILPEFMGIDYTNLLVTVNGTELYNIALLADEDKTIVDNYTLDSNTGTFSKLYPFQAKDSVAIRQI